MTDRPQSEIIREHPIGTGLDAFRASFESLCRDRGISHPTPDAFCQLSKKDLQNLAFRLLSSILQILPVILLLRSNTGRTSLLDDVLKYLPALTPGRLDNFNSDQFEPLFSAVFNNKPDDEIWD